jgi:hypothetical protein
MRAQSGRKVVHEKIKAIFGKKRKKKLCFSVLLTVDIVSAAALCVQELKTSSPVLVICIYLFYF